MKIATLTRLTVAGLVILFLSNQTSAQKTDNLAELQRQLEHSATDFAKFEILKKLSRSSFDGRLSLDERIDYLTRALDLEIDSVELKLNEYNELGRLYWLAGKPDESLAASYKVIEIASDLGLETWISNGYANVATSNKSLGNYQLAYNAEKKALEIITRTNDSLLIFNGLSNHVETLYILERRQEMDSVIAMADAYFKDPDDRGFEYVNAILAITKAYIMAEETRYTESDSLFQVARKVFAIYQNSELDQSLAIAAIKLANIYMEKGLIQKSIDLATFGYDIGNKHQLNEVIRNASEVLYQALEQTGDLEKSIFFLKSYFQYRDTLLNIENVKKVEALRADFEISQKQNEVDLLETQKKAREQFLLGMGIITLLLLIGTSIVFRSLQLQRRLGRELTTQKFQLEQLNAAKDKLFSIVSHDLRGPIIAFSGVSSMIQMGIKKDDMEMLGQIAEEVSKSSMKLNDMLENLLTWAMEEQNMMEPKPEKVPLADLLEEIELIYRQQAQAKQIELLVESPSDQLSIKADKNAAATILRNLIGNAIKFTPEHGQVKVKTASNETFVDLIVSDNGIGMTKEQTNAIFSFQSAKPSFGTSGEKGLGLGLNLVASMVDKNHGEIRVESALHQGTMFTISLPRAES